MASRGIRARLDAVVAQCDSWNEADHPRGGDPENTGRFSTSAGGGGGGGPEMQEEWDRAARALQPFREKGQLWKRQGTHRVLDALLKGLPAGGYLHHVASVLRKTQGDIPIYFTKEDTIGDNEVAAGIYTGGNAETPDLNPADVKDSIGEAIEIASGQWEDSPRFPPSQIARNVVHEIVHASTARLLKHAPDNPIVKDCTSLWGALKAHFDRQGAKTGKDSLYGLKNVQEMVAEAIANPEFQQALHGIKIADLGQGVAGMLQKYTKAPTVLSGIFGMVGRMLGFNKPDDQSALHAVLTLTGEVANEQGRITGGKVKRGEASEHIGLVRREGKPEYGRKVKLWEDSPSPSLG